MMLVCMMQIISCKFGGNYCFVGFFTSFLQRAIVVWFFGGSDEIIFKQLHFLLSVEMWSGIKEVRNGYKVSVKCRRVCKFMEEKSTRGFVRGSAEGLYWEDSRRQCRLTMVLRDNLMKFKEVLF